MLTKVEQVGVPTWKLWWGKSTCGAPNVALVSSRGDLGNMPAPWSESEAIWVLTMSCLSDKLFFFNIGSLWTQFPHDVLGKCRHKAEIQQFHFHQFALSLCLWWLTTSLTVGVRNSGWEANCISKYFFFPPPLGRWITFNLYWFFW